jgi:aldose 1-epimerase
MSGNIVLVEESIFGVLSNGDQVKRYIVKNKLNDFSFSVISFGASIHSINIVDKDNNLVNVACGYDKLEEYLDQSMNPYFGATVGRVANRISNGEFKINGKTFKLEKNNGNSCHHGGKLGLARVSLIY